MNTRDFEYFLAVYQHKNISKAAEALYVSQPALSRYISNLEKKLNVSLFDRKQSPLSLTPAGVQFLKYAQTVQNLERQLKEEFSLINHTMGHVVLGVPPLTGDFLIPQFLPNLRKELVGVKIDIVLENTTDLKNSLLSNRIDLAILSAPMQAADIETRLLINDPIYLIIHKNHPVALSTGGDFGTISHPLPVRLSQFQTETFLLLPPEKQFHNTVHNIFDFYGFKPFDTVTVPTMNIAAELVQSGMGISFGLMSMLMRYRDNNYFCTLPDSQYLPITIAYSKHAATINTSIKCVVDCIYETFHKELEYIH